MVRKQIVRVMVCLLLVVSLSSAIVSRAEASATSDLLTQLSTSLSALQEFLTAISLRGGLKQEVTAESLMAGSGITVPGYIKFTPEIDILDPKTQLAIPKLGGIDVLKKSDTEYYITGTTIGNSGIIQIFHSADLKTFNLVAVFKPSLSTTTTDYCAVWAPDLSYIEGEYVLTFSAQKRKEGQACENTSSSMTNEPTLFEVRSSDLFHFGTPKPIRYGTVSSGVGYSQNTMKIDPDRFGNRLYYVWFGGGNNISSVSTVAPYDSILHTRGTADEGYISEAPQLFRRNDELYMQFSVFDFRTGYTTKYMMGKHPSDLVRKRDNVGTIASPIVKPGCVLTDSACVLENYGHGAIFSRGNQYYYLHTRTVQTGVGPNSRGAYLTPIYFQSDGKIVSMTKTKISWNQLGAEYQYSLDVLSTDGLWINCMSSSTLMNQSNATYNGLCNATTSVVIRKQNIQKFRVCYSRDTQWGVDHSKCVEVENDQTKDTLTLSLAPLHTPVITPLPTPITNSSKTTLSWNQLGGAYRYSLDVLPTGGTWIGPCLSVNLIGNQTRVTYAGVCRSANNTAVAKRDVDKFRLCYTHDEVWGFGHVKCTTIKNDLTKDVQTFTLTPF